MVDYPTAQAPDMSDFDPFGMELRANPWELFPKLIANSPGFIVAEGTPSAFVASHADVVAVTHDYKRFSSVKPKGLPGMERFDMFNSQPVMNYSDPPDHTRRRRVVSASFTPRRIAQLNDDTDALIATLLDKVAGKAEVDALAEICQPMSTEILLGSLMNVAPEDRHLFFATMGGMSLLDQLRPGDPKPKQYLEAWAAGADYCRKAIAKARAEKTENLIGLVAAAADEGGSISDDEMMAMLLVLLTGGLSTMAAAAAAALLGIAQEPELKQRIKDDPTLADNALEEAMRLHPPITLSMRFALVDAEIGGKVIPAGTPVYALWAAANHDPSVFPDPERFDIDRPNVKSHLAFGCGIHTCIGNTITRGVAPRLINAMVQRYPNFRLAHPESTPQFNRGSARGRHLVNLPLILE